MSIFVVSQKVLQSAVIIVCESYGRHNVDEYPYQNSKATYITLHHHDL